ncbi:MAG TPA: hypothetical protein VLV78_18030 [Thermoanaerobaculia bacterium]|nr:hypothetical protein [Thermoanaerobaculia bacterium]
MSRYIKKFGRIGQALGPSEERGFAMWVGYDIAGLDQDLSGNGMIHVDGWTDEQLAAYGVTSFAAVGPEDEETYRKLGIERKS